MQAEVHDSLSTHCYSTPLIDSHAGSPMVSLVTWAGASFHFHTSLFHTSLFHTLSFFPSRVADDESRHLGWCLQRLGELGHAYGDMPAHNLLWEGAQMSAGDLNARCGAMTRERRRRRCRWKVSPRRCLKGNLKFCMRRLAIIPLSQEARGLDAGTRIVQRLVRAGPALNEGSQSIV